MLFTILGLKTYGVVHVAALLLFQVLALLLFRRARLSTWHAVALTVLYLLCNFPAAKVLFDVVKGDGLRPLPAYFTLGPYLEGGLWGWLLVFLPAVLVYPFVAGVRDRVAFFRCLVPGLMRRSSSLQKQQCWRRSRSTSPSAAYGRGARRCRRRDAASAARSASGSADLDRESDCGSSARAADCFRGATLGRSPPAAP